MVALTTRYPTSSQPIAAAPKTDARTPQVTVQITPQLIATRKAIQKIQEAAAVLSQEKKSQAEYVNKKSLIEYVQTSPVSFRSFATQTGKTIKVMHGFNPNALFYCGPDALVCKLSDKDEAEQFLEKHGKEIEINAKTPTLYVIADNIWGEYVNGLEKHKQQEMASIPKPQTPNLDKLPSFEELKRERDALKDDPANHRYDKTVYYTTLIGASIAFFVPNNTKVAEAAKKLGYLTPTLNQIVEVEGIQRNINSLFTSRIVMKQTLETVKEYSSNEAFKNIDPDKWWKMPSRINALANLLSIKE
jgi:hypothetical protein